MNFPPEITETLGNYKHIVTRFPPEPNGYLHIGHVKAMCIDFGLAQTVPSGECILRFDDTNPCNDYAKFVSKIKENIDWLGFKPSKITYTSDYFDALYDLGVKLLETGNGYICELSGDEISEYRTSKKDSPWKNRSVEENLYLFQGMKMGKYSEGKYTMRMKGDFNNPNSCMWDLVFFRNIMRSHPRTGDKWCLYPSYDFSHCIVDSLEGITHSLCTKEFEVRRESYFWLLDVLNLRKPVVYEFSRLNIEECNLSKRHINKLVEDGTVESWEDPNLLTVCGMRNKGYPPTAIKEFAMSSGITKIESVMKLEKLHYYVNDELNRIAERRVAILDPAEVDIENLDEVPDHYRNCLFKNYPMLGDESSTRKITLTKKIFINNHDFRFQDDKKYYGFAVDKICRLKYSGFFKCTKCLSFDTGGKKVIKKIYLKYIPDELVENPKKIKGVLLWCNEDAKTIKFVDYVSGDVFGEENIDNSTVIGTSYQFEKLGYFVKSSETSFTFTNGLRSSYKPE